MQRESGLSKHDSAESESPYTPTHFALEVQSVQCQMSPVSTHLYDFNTQNHGMSHRQRQVSGSAGACLQMRQEIYSAHDSMVYNNNLLLLLFCVCAGTTLGPQTAC